MSILVCWYISTFPHFYILMFSHFKLLIICRLYDSVYPLFYSFTSFISPISYALILNQYKSLFSICTILFIKSVTPTPFSLSSSSKNLVSKLLIRGVLYPDLIWWLLLFLIPPIRSLASECCTYAIAVILLLSEIMPSCSRCNEKKLVYIIIMAPFSR